MKHFLLTIAASVASVALLCLSVPAGAADVDDGGAFLLLGSIHPR